MKVGFVAPMSISVVNGGIRTQASFTIQFLEKLGISAHLISPWKETKLEELDLVHVFGASIENTGIIDQVAASKVPLALSTVFYSTRSSGTIKTAINAEKWLSSLGSGIRSDFSIKADLCHKADLLLPNTSEEARLIEEGFSVSGDKIEVIPNGVEAHFSEAKPDAFINEYGIKDFVLFTGQAGAARKNVLSLLKAAEKLDMPVVIIGDFADDDYSQECLKLAAVLDHVHLIPSLPHDSELLASAYAACKVFVLPSLYETPGIAAMEAALAGAQIVITKHGGTKDYFGESVEYIEPASEESIYAGIQKAFRKESSPYLKKHILEQYSWEKVAEKTLHSYKTLVN
ncbi:glycosyltransferase [Gracilimonas mengyeensis]|uniref:Glycosyltransferase involved in cell wall bisynthesis n=1 Tax=Gracilimonas mengyeensis TaxID=1302730 RepID=A0A521AGZ2_9BACT|nr:glycosyltransferase [Gracilimonas mengyeensis]SMO33970.1 Glycosyltransferase involved in cell wall bisynthesis [Gracilimonas mengyeensis]